MQLRHRQRGLGMWGWIYVLATAGFMILVGMQAVPVYTSEMAIQKVVKAAATDSSSGSLSELHKSLQTRWDVEGITTLDAKDVKIVPNGQGKALAYEYDAKVPLFANATLLLHFAHKFPMSGTPAE